jgi:hypothetical protein
MLASHVLANPGQPSALWIVPFWWEKFLCFFSQRNGIIEFGKFFPGETRLAMISVPGTIFLLA